MIGLPLSQGAHNLKSLDGRIRCLHSSEPTNRPDQLLQLAMICLHNIVEILHLAVDGVFRALAFLLQLSESDPIRRSPVRVDDGWFLPFLDTPQRLGEEPLRCLGISGRREIKINRVAEFVYRSIEIGPLIARQASNAPPRGGPAP